MSDLEYLWDKRHAVLYRVELSTLYHQKRERFFGICEKLVNAIGVVGGSTALASLSNPVLLAWIALTITVASTASLVIGLSDRANRHALLARDFRLLEADILSKGERDFTEQDILSWQSNTRRLESSEPASLGALVVICQNELAVAQGHPSHVTSLTRIQYALAHFCDFNSFNNNPTASSIKE